MAYKISNVTIENHFDSEWEVRFHFGETFLSLWIHKDMTIKGLVYQLMDLAQRFIQNYIG